MNIQFIQAQGAECPPSIKCAACSNPWNQPTELFPCSHIFCKECVDRSNWSCPTCHSQIDDSAPAHELLQTMASRAQVQCTNCGWHGMRQSSKVHRCPVPRPAEDVKVEPLTPSNDVVVGTVVGSVVPTDPEETQGALQEGIVVPERPKEEESASASMETTVAVIRSASDPTNRKPWFDYNLTHKEYQSMKSDFERAALSTSLHARITKDAVTNLLKAHQFDLLHPHQEIEALMALFNKTGSLMSPTVSFEELLTWLRYSTATKVSSAQRTTQTRKQKELEANEEEQSKTRINNFVHDQMNVPSVDELTASMGTGLPSTLDSSPPPISSFGLGGDGGMGGMGDIGGSTHDWKNF